MRSPETIRFLCVENLHPFEAPALAHDLECPQCGCKWARMDTSSGSNTTTTTTVVMDTKEPYAINVDPNNWVSKLPEVKEQK